MKKKRKAKTLTPILAHSVSFFATMVNYNVFPIPLRM